MIQKKGVIIIELIRNAVTGANLIPTTLLGLVLLYWMIVIMGLFDFSFLDFDFDFDLEGAEGSDILSGIFVFLNVAELPLMLFLSILILNFWILSMLMYYLPIASGGLINGLLLIPAFILSMFLTKYETTPLKGIFKASNSQDDRAKKILHELCTLRGAIENGRLGQAELMIDGPSIVINVKPETEGETFNKGEVAFIWSKDSEKNVYYIRKLHL